MEQSSHRIHDASSRVTPTRSRSSDTWERILESAAGFGGPRRDCIATHATNELDRQGDGAGRYDSDGSAKQQPQNLECHTRTQKKERNVPEQGAVRTGTLRHLVEQGLCQYLRPNRYKRNGTVTGRRPCLRADVHVNETRKRPCSSSGINARIARGTRFMKSI